MFSVLVEARIFEDEMRTLKTKTRWLENNASVLETRTRAKILGRMLLVVIFDINRLFIILEAKSDRMDLLHILVISLFKQNDRHKHL